MFFPAATSYDNSTSGLRYAVQASGASSRIDLSNLTTFVGSGGFGATTVTASNGGRVDLSGAISGGGSLTLTGATSILSVTGVISLADLSVNVNTSGSVTFPAVAGLARVNLNSATGGQMLFPAATSFDNGGTNSGYTVQADGTGSRIDLSALTTFIGGTASIGSTTVTAGNGGRVDLAGSLSGRGSLNLSGATSRISFDAVTRFTSIPITATNSATIEFSAACDIAFGPGNVLRLADASSALSIDPAADLDIENNALVIDYFAASPLNAIRALLTSGYAAGAWNGPGINSSVAAADPNDEHAVGYAESSGIFTSFPANFAGQSVDNTAVLLRYTLYGDANLDQRVNLNDFNRLAASFGQTNRDWYHGNFNYDQPQRIVSLSDFNLLAGNFGQVVGPEIMRGAFTPTLSESWLHQLLEKLV